MADIGIRRCPTKQVGVPLGDRTGQDRLERADPGRLRRHTVTAEPKLPHDLRQLERAGRAGLVRQRHVSPADKHRRALRGRRHHNLVHHLAEPLHTLKASELLRPPLLADLGVHGGTVGWCHHGAATGNHRAHAFRCPEIRSTNNIVGWAVTEHAEPPHRVTVEAFGGQSELVGSSDG